MNKDHHGRFTNRGISPIVSGSIDGNVRDCDDIILLVIFYYLLIYQAEAVRWKSVVEMQIAVLEGRRPPPPPEIDLQGIDRWMRSSSWRRVGVQEGLRILEEESASKGKAGKPLCRKTQVKVADV